MHNYHYKKMCTFPSYHPLNVRVPDSWQFMKFLRSPDIFIRYKYKLIIDFQVVTAVVKMKISGLSLVRRQNEDLSGRPLQISQPDTLIALLQSKTKYTMLEAMVYSKLHLSRVNMTYSEISINIINLAKSKNGHLQPMG